MAENLEQELAKLEQEYDEKRAALEKQKESGEVKEVPQEKETLREVVIEKTTPPGEKPLVEVKKQEYPLGIPSYEMPGMKEQVQEYVNIAFNESPQEAVNKVRATHNPALIDAFHDALVDQLYDELVKRGKIKEFKQAA